MLSGFSEPYYWCMRTLLIFTDDISLPVATCNWLGHIIILLGQFAFLGAGKRSQFRWWWQSVWATQERASPRLREHRALLWLGCSISLRFTPILWQRIIQYKKCKKALIVLTLDRENLKEPFKVTCFKFIPWVHHWRDSSWKVWHQMLRRFPKHSVSWILFHIEEYLCYLQGNQWRIFTHPGFG